MEEQCVQSLQSQCQGCPLLVQAWNDHQRQFTFRILLLVSEAENSRKNSRIQIYIVETMSFCKALPRQYLNLIIYILKLVYKHDIILSLFKLISWHFEKITQNVKLATTIRKLCDATSFLCCPEVKGGRRQLPVIQLSVKNEQSAEFFQRGFTNDKIVWRFQQNSNLFMFIIH